MINRLLRMLTLAVTMVTAAMALGAPKDPLPDPQYPPGIAELTVDSNGERLSGLIYMANGAGPHPTIVLLHGFPGNEKNLDIAQTLRRDGFNVLFFHYRGAWGSEGHYDITQLDDDVLAVLGFLRHPDNARRYRVDVNALSLLGHSLGGYAALATGSKDKYLSCVAAMSPANPGVWLMSVHSGGKHGQRLLHYADTLFMLRDFNGAAMKLQLREATMEELDTRLFGPGLLGKQVFMVVGDKDPVTTQAEMFDPVVEAYSSLPGMQLEHHVIPGDHSYSWSRLQLTGLLQEFFASNCR
jgi:uncharacterized protein